MALRSQVMPSASAHTVWGRSIILPPCCSLFISVFMDVWHCSSHTGHLDAFQESELFELPNICLRARAACKAAFLSAAANILSDRRPLFLLSADFTPRSVQPITINLHRTSTAVNQNRAARRFSTSRLNKNTTLVYLRTRILKAFSDKLIAHF